ncbi:MAG: hypothetical protein ABI595_09305 [Actinomycetota bacterium]
MQRGRFGRWLDAHFAAWMSNEADDVVTLFTGILLITFALNARCRDHPEWLVRRELPVG